MLLEIAVNVNAALSQHYGLGPVAAYRTRMALSPSWAFSLWLWSFMEAGGSNNFCWNCHLLLLLLLLLLLVLMISIKTTFFFFLFFLFFFFFVLVFVFAVFSLSSSRILILISAYPPFLVSCPNILISSYPCIFRP